MIDSKAFRGKINFPARPFRINYRFIDNQPPGGGKEKNVPRAKMNGEKISNLKNQTVGFLSFFLLLL